MQTHKGPDYTKLVEAVLQIAQNLAEGKDVSKSEIASQLRKTLHEKPEESFLTSMSKGMGIPQTEQVLGQELGRAIMDGFKLMSGDISGVIQKEFSSIGKTKMELEHTKPGEKLAAWASEMASTGHMPSREELERMHDRFTAIGERQARAVSEAGDVSSFIPSVFRVGIEGTTGYWMDKAKQVKDWADKQLPLYENNRMHED